MKPGLSMGVAIAIGVGIGVAMDNLAVGVGIGIFFGSISTALLQAKQRRDEEKSRLDP